MKRFDKEQTRKLFEHLISNLDFVNTHTFDKKSNSFTIFMKQEVDEMTFNRVIQNNLLKSVNYVFENDKELNRDEYDPSIIFTLAVEKQNARISY